VAHAVSTGALFILVGQIHERIHTHDMARMGGLWETAPRLGGATLFFALASLGLPGLANFVGEFLTLLGVYRVSVPFAAVAALGLVAAAIYSLWIIQRVFHGPNREGRRVPDMTLRETCIVAVLIAVSLGVGLYPRPLLRTAEPALDALQRRPPGEWERRMPPAGAMWVERIGRSGN